MDSSVIIALISAFLGSGIITAAANNMWQRRRNRADTAAVLNDTALDLVVPLREQIKEMRGEIAVYRQRVGMLERRERERFAVLSAHQAWDMIAHAHLMANKIDVGSIPPLFPMDTGRQADERTRAEDYGLADTREPPPPDQRHRRRRAMEFADESGDRETTSTETDAP